MPQTNFLYDNDFYISIIRKLISCLNAGYTDAQTAKALNDSAILSPAGRPFTPNAVNQILKKIRNHKEYPSRIHKALLQACFDGQLNAADTLILFQPRRQQGAM